MKTMPFFKISLLGLCAITLFSCKTQEQIQREQMVDNMSLQLVQNQKISAESNVELQQLKDQNIHLSGKIEEIEHANQQANEQREKVLMDRLALVEEKNKVLAADVNKLQKDQEVLVQQIGEQAKFIQSVLASLKKMGGHSSSKGASQPKSLLDQANADYKKGKYTKAEKNYLELIDDKSIKSGDRVGIIHNLGMISYLKKKNDKALMYFSKLFTEFPKSGYNKNGLYHLALTFQRLKKESEYKQTLNELITRFPKSKMAKKAEKLLK